MIVYKKKGAAYLDFLLPYVYEKDLYHQQSDALYSIELPRSSLIQIKKIGGPRTESCGRPPLTGVKSELYPLIETSCLRSDK